jgi:simple sugar transport system ATP-binding protein
MRHITKRFGPVAALDDVSLRIEAGEVHGLLGENGAGKSTLMNVLFGLLPLDAGSIHVNGTEKRIASPRAAQALGIGMVHQHFKLVPTLSVMDNLALALHMPVRKVQPLALACMRQLRWEVPAGARVDTISVGQQQRVEIIKALLAAQRGGRRGTSAETTRTLILDEPTAVLTPQETAELFNALASLKSPAGGNTAIVFISHKLAEVQKICDAVTILRRGKVVHAGPARELSAGQMTEMMVGAAIELPRLERDHGNMSGEPMLRVRQVACGTLKDASLEVSAGEILGIAGVDGNGQADLVQVIVGGAATSAGRIFMEGHDATDKSIRWRSDRIAYIPEDRQRQALVLPLSIQQNLLLRDYRDRPFSVLGWLRFGAWQTHAVRLAARFDVRCRTLSDPVASLSGGNQQKVVLARELGAAAKKIVIAVNPTRGLDVGATAFVMRELLSARARGAAVLLVHSDLDELLAISDRVAVLYNGTLTASLWPRDTKEGIGRLMLGLPAAPAAAP